MEFVVSTLGREPSRTRGGRKLEGGVNQGKLMLLSLNSNSDPSQLLDAIHPLARPFWLDKRLNLVTFLHTRTKVGLYEPGSICFPPAT